MFNKNDKIFFLHVSQIKLSVWNSEFLIGSDLLTSAVPALNTYYSVSLKRSAISLHASLGV